MQIAAREKKLALVRQLTSDIFRMQNCARYAGHSISEADIVDAWAEHSSCISAIWAVLPDSDDLLLSILLKHLPRTGSITRTSIKPGQSGNCAGILELSSETLEQMEWQVGDALVFTPMQEGMLLFRKWK